MLRALMQQDGLRGLLDLCCASPRGWDRDELAADVTGSTPLMWSGAASVVGRLHFTMDDNGGAVKDDAGAVVLNAARGGAFGRGDFDVCWSDPSTGQVVLLICLTQHATFFTRKPYRWTVYTSEPGSAGERVRETAPTGATLFKAGTMTSKDLTTVTFHDLSEKAALMTQKKERGFFRYKTYVRAETKPAAFMDRMAYSCYSEGWFDKAQAYCSRGRCTFAKGADPVMMLAMACATAPLAMYGNGD